MKVLSHESYIENDIQNDILNDFLNDILSDIWEMKKKILVFSIQSFQKEIFKGKYFAQVHQPAEKFGLSRVNLLIE